MPAAPPTPGDPSRGRPRPLLVIGLAVVMGALWLRWRDALAWSYADLEVYVRGGRAIIEGTDVYADRAGVLPFTYPPFAAVVFIPLTLLGSAGPYLFTAGSLIAYGAVLWVVTRATSLGRWDAMLLGLVGLTFEPVMRTLVLGQVGLVIAAGVLLDLLVLPRAWRGVVIGILAGVKLTPAFFVVFFALRRDWSAVIRSGSTFLASVALGWVVLPSASSWYWLGGWNQMSRFGPEAITPANQSARAVLARLLRVAEPTAVVTIPVAALLAGLAIWCARRTLTRSRLGAVVALALGSLLLSPISWTHHWVWFIPLVAVLLDEGRRVAAALVAAVAFFAPPWLLMGASVHPLDLTVGGQGVAAAYAVLAVLLLGVLGLGGAVGRGPHGLRRRSSRLTRWAGRSRTAANERG